MKTLLNFTQGLVMAVIFMALFCQTLSAKGIAVTMDAPGQGAGKVIAGFIVLLVVIILPLIKKRIVASGK